MRLTPQTLVALEWAVNDDAELAELQAQAAALGDTVALDGERNNPSDPLSVMDYIQPVLLTTTVARALQHHGETVETLLDSYLDEDDYPGAEGELEKIASLVRWHQQDTRSLAYLESRSDPSQDVPAQIAACKTRLAEINAQLA